MFEGQPAEIVRDGPQLAGPVRIGGVDGELFQDDLGDTVEQCGLVRHMPVEHRGIAAHRVAEAAHRQAVHPIAVDDRQGGPQDDRAGDLGVPGFRRDRHGLGPVPVCWVVVMAGHSLPPPHCSPRWGSTLLTTSMVRRWLKSCPSELRTS